MPVREATDVPLFELNDTVLVPEIMFDTVHLSDTYMVCREVHPENI